MFIIDEELKKLPDKPGVYLMKDKSDDIIYVGKAISLRSRVRQYFRSQKNQSLKVRSMVSHIKEFEYIIVDNEVEALVLEANLIKKNRPKYNILLRDDKQYPYIKVTLNEKYPRVIKTRQIVKDGSKYFGPYPSASAVNDSIDILHDIYPIRNCKLNLEKNLANFRPCLNYYIGKCCAPCLGSVDEEEYMEMIREIIQFLDGKSLNLIDNIENKMFQASNNKEFEKASIFRDQLNALRTLQEEQKIVSTDNVNQDIIAMARGIEEVCVQVFFIRAGKIIGREHFLLEDRYGEEKGEILSSFIKQFYIGSAYIPKEIILEANISDLEVVEKWLGNKRASKVSITVPKKGDKLRLVEMVKENALEMLNKYGDRFLKRHRENLKALEEIQYILDLEDFPERIEAYDISNISGVQAVGSMVVFENGEAKKSDYRRFRIKSIVNPDDYGSMEEVLNRRFIRGLVEQEHIDDDIKLKGFSSFPDLIMIDGGKGQANIALNVLSKLGIYVPVCALVKDDYHKTRGIIYNNKEYHLPKDSLGFKMVYKIQEEAHRFAISYHKSLRTRDMFKSQLDDIEGIGEKRKVALMKHFKSIDKIKNASIEELSAIKSMNKVVAENLYNHFNKDREDENNGEKNL